MKNFIIIMLVICSMYQSKLILNQRKAMFQMDWAIGTMLYNCTGAILDHD